VVLFADDRISEAENVSFAVCAATEPHIVKIPAKFVFAD
jgi:hypothetical protein